MKKILLLLLTMLGLAGCASTPSHPALQAAADLPKLLPVREFVANVKFNGGYTISPDGKKIAWFGVHGFGPALLVKTVGQDQVTAFKGIPIGLHWAQDSRRLFYLKDQGGNENFHVMMVDSEQAHAEPVDLTPYPGIQATIVRVIQSDPAHILVAHNQRDKKLSDLYKINIDTRQQMLVAQNPGDAVNVVTDPAGKLVAVVRQTADKTTLANSDTLKEILAWNSEETVEVLDVASDGRSVYLLSNRNRNLVGLTRLDLQTGQETPVHEEAEADIEHVQIGRVSRLPLLAASTPGYPKTHFLDARLQADLAPLMSPALRALHILSMDDSEQHMTLRIDEDGSTKYYLFDRGNGRKTLIGEAPNSAHAAQLASPQPITVQSRDGLPLHGYLTLPKGAKAERLPTVLLVHGGPWWRDHWDNGLGMQQFLANRGYAVLQINYRGSTGYGRAFTEAGIGEFGGTGKMHNDLMDGVQWAVKQGISDPGKVAIMGASFGGYATLAGLTFTPDAYACGIDLVGPSNLATLQEEAPEYWKPFMHRMRKYMGDPSDPEQRKKMLAQSPISHAANVRSPLLIVQGANDPRVKRAQSDLMVEALRQAGKQVDYMPLANEGHGTTNWPNNLKIYRRAEDFLAKCLGGRSSGFDMYELASWMF